MAAARLLKYLLLGVGAFILTAVAVIAFDFAFLRGQTPAIKGERSIAALEEIELGGVKQWILVRGLDRGNPVILFLHGGPGMPAMYLAHAWQSQLERDFIVVHWDRRGAGKSFAAASDGSRLTVSQTLADTFELTRLLLDRFDRDRIYLVGHSWGSYLGLLAVREHPEYYAAFIGTGQVTGDPARTTAVQREFLVRAANRVGKPEEAQRFVAPDYRITESDLFRYGAELHDATSLWPILSTGLRAREYTFSDAINLRKGAQFIGREMVYDVEPHQQEGEVAAVDIPVFMMLGRYDFNSPSPLAAEYLDRLQSPLKKLVWFDKSAHFPFFEEPERFHEEFRSMHLAVEKFWLGATD